VINVPGGYDDEDSSMNGGGPPTINVSAPQIHVSSAPPSQPKPSPALPVILNDLASSAPSSSKRRLPQPPGAPTGVPASSAIPGSGSGSGAGSGIRSRGGGLVCAGCRAPIIGRIVSAMNVRWHPHCFKCSTCGELLEHVSSYENEGRPYCHLDYHEVSLSL
jgi:hypothetical protein